MADNFELQPLLRSTYPERGTEAFAYTNGDSSIEFSLIDWVDGRIENGYLTFYPFIFMS